MPLNTGGKLSLVASADIGGLGARDGARVDYTWVMPSLAPILLPYLVILALLMLKPNRCASAWLIWLPLGCFVLLTSLVTPYTSPSTSFFMDVVDSMALGLSAVWLLLNALSRKHPLVTFLCVFPALTAFTMGAAFSRLGIGLDASLIQVGAVILFGGFVTSVALSLTGLACRRQYRPTAMHFWMLLFLSVTWLLVTMPFFVIAILASSAPISWWDFIGPVLGVAMGNFALLFPFLLLALLNPFYRTRLKALLHIKAEPTPEAVPAVEINLKPLNP